MTTVENKDIKLNLGCGNKLMTDCINVDVIRPQGELPQGVQFVEDDIRALEKFQDNSVSLILAMHLVEHIPVYDIEPTLIRWNEVLKEGGHVIVELPCLMKSCINTLQGLTTKDSQISYNLGILGIYGLPDPKNPWMEHKWGWTFQTLSQQFRNAGFVNIREEPAVTHMKGARDFRLVAEKEIKTNDNTTTNISSK